MADGDQVVPNINPAQLSVLVDILSAQRGAGTSPAFNASALAGVSPSSIAGVFKPEMLLASGLVTPQNLQAGIGGQYDQLIQQFLAETAASSTPPADATTVPFTALARRYGVTPVDVGDGTIQFSNSSGTDLGELMATQFNAIYSNVSSADLGATTIADKASKGEGSYGQFAPLIGQITDDLKEFESAANRQKNAYAEFEYRRSTSPSNAVAPTRQQAMAEYYNQIGLPQLALLGDPTATYDVPTYAFVNQAERTRFQNELNRILPSIRSAQDQYAGQIAASRKAAEIGYQELLKKAAEDATSGFYSGLGGGAGGGGGGSWGAPRGTGGFKEYTTGAAEGGRAGITPQERRNQAIKAAQVAVERPKSLTLADLAPEVATQVSQAKRLEEQMRRQDEMAKIAANIVSQGLAARGITPFNTQLQNMLGYTLTQKKS